jgi:hypothetical protein
MWKKIEVLTKGGNKGLKIKGFKIRKHPFIRMRRQPSNNLTTIQFNYSTSTCFFTTAPSLASIKNFLWLMI